MFGIAGIVAADSHQQWESSLACMLNSMLHKATHRFGTYVDNRLQLWGGWTFAKGLPSPSQPFWNERKDIGLIFSGEEFTEPAEIDRLRGKGHEFAAGGPEYLVHLYEEYGLSFLENLNGSFSGLLLDLRTQKMVLFNDRYGLNRIYFCEKENEFYFSSEAKSLLKVLPGVRKLDLKSLGEFLSCGCVLQNRTLFSGISLLPPGSAWTFAPGQPIQRQTYFSPKIWEEQPQLDASEYYEELRETWRRILPRYFRGNDRVALSLTGGVDSRMILAWAQGPPGAMPCYTFGGRYRDCRDVKIAREVAGISRQPHHVLSVDGEFLSEFPVLAEKAIYLSDGGMDVTGSIDLYLQKKARTIAPVRITGTNGGEVLRRIVVFNPKPISQRWLQPEIAGMARESAATYATELQGHRLSFTAFKQAPWFMGSKFVLERSEVTLRMPYFDNDLTKVLYRAPKELVESNNISLRLIADGNPALGKIPTDRGGAGCAAKASRLFHDFTFKAEYAYDYGMPQWLAKIDRAMAPLHLEKLFLGRHKIHHFRIHYRDKLAHYLREVLLDERTLGRPYFQRGGVAEIVRGHLRGDRNYTLEIHKLLTIEMIQRQLIEQN